jgi:hypothetical protein
MQRRSSRSGSGSGSVEHQNVHFIRPRYISRSLLLRDRIGIRAAMDAAPLVSAQSLGEFDNVFVVCSGRTSTHIDWHPPPRPQSLTFLLLLKPFAT